MRRSSIGRDALIAAALLVLLAVLPMVFPNKSLSDFVMRASAFAVFATSLNLLGCHDFEEAPPLVRRQIEPPFEHDEHVAVSRDQLFDQLLARHRVREHPVEILFEQLAA